LAGAILLPRKGTNSDRWLIPVSGHHTCDLLVEACVVHDHVVSCALVSWWWVPDRRP
jgi:hypothetical protein